MTAHRAFVVRHKARVSCDAEGCERFIEALSYDHQAIAARKRAALYGWVRRLAPGGPRGFRWVDLCRIHGQEIE